MQSFVYISFPTKRLFVYKCYFVLPLLLKLVSISLSILWLIANFLVKVIKAFNNVLLLVFSVIEKHYKRL